MKAISRCSKLEKSALSPEASFKADVEGELICLLYNQNFSVLVIKIL